jgi:hypothetical protein
MKPIIVVLAVLTFLAGRDTPARAAGTQSWAPNLSGLYRCVRSCAGPSLGRVVARGWRLTLTAENGETTRAWIDWPGHIWVPALNEGAVYSADGFTIQFERGSVWVLVNPEPIPGSAGY